MEKRAKNDNCLLRRYTHSGSQAAFARLIECHINLVYSTCFLELQNRELAEEATQTVFLVLARKAHVIRSEAALASWLYTTARFEARVLRVREGRRMSREHLAAEEARRLSTQAESGSWSSIEPELNDAIAALPARDQQVILLRFFEQMSLHEVGAALGLSEDAARKRVARALDKVRTLLLKNLSISVPVATLTTILSAHALNSVSPEFSAAVTKSALAGFLASVGEHGVHSVTASLAKGFLVMLTISIVAGAALIMVLSGLPSQSESRFKTTSSINRYDAKFTEIERHSLEVNNAPQITIDNGRGRIKVTASTSPDSAVRVTATKHAARQADCARLAVQVEQAGNIVHIYVRRPTPDIENLWADLDVSAPSGSSVQESSSDGDVAANGFRGDVVAKTSNGDISLTACAGHADAKTSSGRIKIDGARSPHASSGNGEIIINRAHGTIWAKTSSGRIVVRNAAGSLAIDTGNGNLDVSDFDGEGAGQSSSGSIQITGGNGRLLIHTGNGHIRVNGGTHAGIDAACGSGSILLNAPLSYFHASTGNGSISIRTTAQLKGLSSARTSSGQITVTIPRSTRSLSFIETRSSGRTRNSTPNAIIDVRGNITTGHIGDGGQAKLSLTSGNGNLRIMER